MCLDVFLSLTPSEGRLGQRERESCWLKPESTSCCWDSVWVLHFESTSVFLLYVETWCVLMKTRMRCDGPGLSATLCPPGCWWSASRSLWRVMTCFHHGQFNVMPLCTHSFLHCSTDLIYLEKEISSHSNDEQAYYWWIQHVRLSHSTFHFKIQRIKSYKFIQERMKSFL